MCSLDCLDVEVAHAVVLADSCVPRICERAGALVTEPGHIVFVPEKNATAAAERRAWCRSSDQLWGRFRLPHAVTLSTQSHILYYRTQCDAFAELCI